jgi:hypothetical protein
MMKKKIIKIPVKRIYEWMYDRGEDRFYGPGYTIKVMRDDARVKISKYTPFTIEKIPEHLNVNFTGDVKWVFGHPVFRDEVAVGAGYYGYVGEKVKIYLTKNSLDFESEKYEISVRKKYLLKIALNKSISVDEYVSRVIKEKYPWISSERIIGLVLRDDKIEDMIYRGGSYVSRVLFANNDDKIRMGPLLFEEGVYYVEVPVDYDGQDPFLIESVDDLDKDVNVIEVENGQWFSGVSRRANDIFLSSRKFDERFLIFFRLFDVMFFYSGDKPFILVDGKSFSLENLPYFLEARSKEELRDQMIL